MSRDVIFHMLKMREKNIHLKVGREFLIWWRLNKQWRCLFQIEIFGDFVGTNFPNCKNGGEKQWSGFISDKASWS